MQNKIIVATSIVGGILILFLIIIGVKQYNETKKLREEGIHVEALVINKEVLRNKSHRGKAKGNSRSSEYIIDLAVFIDTTKVTQIKKTSKEPQIISDKIDDLFGKSSLNFYYIYSNFKTKSYEAIDQNSRYLRFSFAYCPLYAGSSCRRIHNCFDCCCCPWVT